MKIRHAQQAMNAYGIAVIQKKLALIEPREEEPEKVAEEKIKQVAMQPGQAVMVEDSGIYIKALNGFPKTYVHFACKTLGIENILKLLEGTDDRTAEFHQALAYMEPPMKTPKIFSYIDGDFKVAEKIWASENGNKPGFDQILIPPGEDKPLCSFSEEWRAERDVRQNGEKMHYVQLARWLTGKEPNEINRTDARGETAENK